MKRSKEADAEPLPPIPEESPGSSGAWFSLDYFVPEGGVILSGTPHVVGLRCKGCQVALYPTFGIALSGTIFVRGHTNRVGNFVPPNICDDCAHDGVK